jgi:leucyl aminopeptidase (aminopeptidase T)
MNNWDKMIHAAAGAMEFIFQPGAEDKMLILTDDESASIADAFKQAAVNKGCLVESYFIENTNRPLKEIPAALEKLLPGKTIVLNIIKSFPGEIQFRIKWIFKVQENKLVKMGHMPGISEEIMLRSVNVDFYKMKSSADLLTGALKNAVRLHITTEEGTDIHIGTKGRKLIGDIGLAERKMCNLPCGEIYCAPVETEADGTVVFNASIADIGLLKEPLKVIMQKGRIVKFESSDEELVKRIAELTDVDENARIIGELGIGVNPGARITGNMLEDEKASGTAHIAFGNNTDFGGKNNSKIHRDYLFYRPTIEVIYADGAKKVIMQKGEISL